MKLQNIIKEKISVNDTFSTKTALLRNLGFPEVKSKHSRDANIKEVERYIEIGKSYKINPKTKKTSNEIMILEIYSEPKDKVDGRYRTGSQEIINELKRLILSLGTVDISYSKIILEYVLNINAPTLKSNEIAYYKSYLFNFLRGKIETSLRQLSNEYPNGFNWRYNYKAKYDGRDNWEYVEQNDIEYILSIKKAIQINLLAKHNNKNGTNVAWGDVSFRYKNALYKQLNKDLMNFKGISEIYKIISIVNRTDINCTEYDKEKILNIIKDKMTQYIKTHRGTEQFHNILFKENIND